MEIGRTSQTSHVATLCWSRAAADYLAPGTCLPGLPSGRQPASLIRSPAGPVAGICTGHPSFKEVRQKFSLSVLHYFHFLLQRIFPTSEVLRNQMSANHRSVLILSCSLESPREVLKTLMLGFCPEILIYWSGVCNQGVRTAQAPPVILMDSQG